MTLKQHYEHAKFCVRKEYLKSLLKKITKLKREVSVIRAAQKKLVADHPEVSEHISPEDFI